MTAGVDSSRVERRTVAEPFAGDDDFWMSARASMLALPALLGAIIVTLAAGPAGAGSFAVPAGLLGLATVRGRRSQRRTRSAFADRPAWRDAERRAVGQVLTGARRAGPR